MFFFNEEGSEPINQNHVNALVYGLSTLLQGPSYRGCSGCSCTHRFLGKLIQDLVEEYFQEFHCACVAISGKGSVVSRHALVTNACKFQSLKP